MMQRIQTRATALVTKLQAQITKIAAKIREKVQQTRDKINELLRPFWEKLRLAQAAVAAGWKRISDAAGDAAERVRGRFGAALDRVGSALDGVRDRARRAFAGLADAAEPHLARLRRGILALRQPFDAVRAYGIGAFRVLADGADRATRPIGRALSRVADQGSDAFARLRDAGSTAFNAIGDRAGAFGRAAAAVFAAARRDNDEFAQAVRRSGLTVEAAQHGMEASARDLTAAEAGLNAERERSTKLEKDLEVAEQRLQAAHRASELAITQRARAEDDLRQAQEEYAAQAQRVADMERRLAADRDSGAVSASRLRGQEDVLNTERDKGWAVADRLEKAEEKLIKAQEREHDTTAKLLEVEQRGIAVRDAADDSADRLAEAHGRVTKATEDSTRAAGLHEAAVRRQEGALGRVSTHLRNVASESDRGSTALRAMARVTDLVGKGFDAVSSIGSKLTDGMGKLEGAFSALGAKGADLLQQIPALVQQMAALAVIGGTVTYAIGAVTAAILAVPAAALGAAAALGVVALGMDGIKKAYDVGLKPALDKLKTQISEVFEQKLTPAFQKLSNELLPQITDKLKTLATSVANVGVHLVDLVTKGENVAKINKIIDTMAQIIASQVDPALQKLIQSFIDLGSNAQILNAIGGMFTDLIGKTADWLAEMNRTGEATRAVEALRDVLGRVEDLFFRVATAAAKFFSDATPGVSKLVDSAGRLVDIVGRLGGAFGDAAGAAADLINSIPQSTLDAIVDAIDRLGQKLKEAGQDRGLQQMLTNLGDALPGIIDGFTQFLDAIQSVADGIEQLQYGVAKADQFLEGLGLSFTTEAEKALIAAHEHQQVGDEIHDGVKQGVDGAKESLDTLPPKAGEAGQGTLDGVKPPVEQIPGVVDNATGQVSFQPVLDAANTVFGQLPTTVADGINKSVDSMTQGTDKIRTSSEQGFKAASDAATTSMTSIGQVVEERMQAAGASAEVGGQRIGDGIRSGVQAAADAAQSGMGRVGEAVRTAMDSAAQTAESGGQRIATAITDNVNRAADSAQSGMSRVSEAVRTGVDQAAQAAQSGMDRIAQSVQTGMDRAADAARTGGDRITDGLRTSTDAAAAAVEAGMQRLSQAVEQGMQRAITAATDGGRRIEDGLRTSLDSVVRITEDSWQRIGQAFQQGGQRCEQIARDTGQRIVQEFQNQAGPMYDAGYQMIARLAAGMIAAQGMAFAAAQSTAAGIRAMFPSSPAKLGPLAGAGDPLRSGGVIMRRLADGISAEAGAVQDALDPVLSQFVTRVQAVAPTATAHLDTTTGAQAPQRLLTDVVVRSAASSGEGLLVAELRRQTDTLVALRADLASTGYGPDMLDRLDRLIAASTTEPAGDKTQRLRSVAALGAFG